MQKGHIHGGWAGVVMWWAGAGGLPYTQLGRSGDAKTAHKAEVLPTDRRANRLIELNAHD